MSVNEYKGYSLFNDVADKALRIRNRAVVMANIASAGRDGESITLSATDDLFRYFNLIDKAEQKETNKAFVARLKEEGFNIE